MYQNAPFNLFCWIIFPLCLSQCKCTNGLLGFHQSITTMLGIFRLRFTKQENYQKNFHSMEELREKEKWKAHKVYFGKFTYCEQKTNKNISRLMNVPKRVVKLYTFKWSHSLRIEFYHTDKYRFYFSFIQIGFILRAIIQ